ELPVERGADRRHRRQREQLVIVERRIGGSRWCEGAVETKSAMVEFAQRQGIDDRGSAFQRGALHRARRQKNAEGEQQRGDEERSKCVAHAKTNTTQRCLFKAKGASRA